MVFSSVVFLFYFLPLFLFGYFFTRYQNAFLLIASLFFYAWGEVEYVLLIILSSFMNYLFGIIISSYKKKARYWFFTGIVLNIGIISGFKYLAFFCKLINEILSFVHIETIPIYSTHLPLGISFFTFQAMSYLVDIYRDDAPLEKNPFNVMLYIAMFPQLIAGPIVRFQTIYKEIHHRCVSSNMFVDGIRYFIIGLSQKVLIANIVAVTADKIFALPLTNLNFSLSWLGAFSYTLQIYYDFAGYSNMAIGLGLMLGFHFPKNFDYPYFAQSITEFWRRWHITLSRWFQDYLYIPLGGNRAGKKRTYLNLMVVFILCGLWHGANWTFVVWGLFHGFFIVIERMGISKFLTQMPRIIGHIYTILVVIIGWVLFRSETFTKAFAIIKNMTGLRNIAYADNSIYTIGYYLQNDVIIALILGTILSIPIKQILKIQWKIKPSIESIGSYLFQIILLLFSIMSIASGAYNPFIYFRF